LRELGRKCGVAGADDEHAVAAARADHGDGGPMWRRPFTQDFQHSMFPALRHRIWHLTLGTQH
jgi:hypothetical protein